MPVGGVMQRTQRPRSPGPGGQGPATLTGEGAPFPGKEGRTHTGDSKEGATPTDTAAHQKGGGSSWVSRGLGGAWEGQGDPVDETETLSPAGLHSDENEKARPPGEAGDGVKGAV